MSVNDFLPFCPTDTGTNLLSEADYLAASDRTSGNKPGIASSKLNNKALRQSSYIASQLAQYVSNQTGEDVLDDATPAKLLAQFMNALQPYSPTITKYASGSGNHNITVYFQIGSGSATAGATYTNNGQTFTVVTTISSGVLLRTTGNGAPLGSGTLTKASGTGDATITFYAFRTPIAIDFIAVGCGGGGGGSGISGQTGGGAGGNTTFGSSLVVANGGAGGAAGGGGVIGGDGGTASITAPAVGISSDGSYGSPGGINNTGSTGGPGGTAAYVAGGSGGPSYLGGRGGGGVGGIGTSAKANSGSGGGGGGCSFVSGGNGGFGGGSGGVAIGSIPNPAATAYSFPYAIGSAGSSGVAGSSGFNAGSGALGVLLLMEKFQ